MLDFHTHILPEIDDGSSSVEESVKMIEMLLKQGVNEILMTPHFYAYISSVKGFADDRDSAMKKLCEELKKRDVEVSLYLGCEVLYFDEIWRIDDIESFCIKGTNYILVEMPFSSWNNSMVENVVNILNRGYIPILAHFERYIKYSGNVKKIRTLADEGVLLQMNCSYINRLFSRARAIRMIKSGMVNALGTDCHNTCKRGPDYDRAIEILTRRLSENQFAKFVTKQKNLLKNAVKVYSGKNN